MAIYYQPPQPYLGGCQPLEPKRLVPPLQVTPGDEPPRYSLVQFYAIALKQWEPGPPPVQGSVAPQIKRVPATEESLSWQPYVPSWPNVVIRAWEPDLSRPFMGGQQPLSPLKITPTNRFNMLANSGIYTVTGTAINALYNRIVSAVGGIYSIVGSVSGLIFLVVGALRRQKTILWKRRRSKRDRP